MPSALARRLVSPTWAHRPEFVETLGPEVADVAAQAGLPPDPEQEMILDTVNGIRPDGKSVVFDTTVIAARQTIKTGLAKMCALGWLYVTEQRLIVWSAHEMDTTREAHGDLAALIEGTPALSRRLARGGILYGNNLQIKLRDGRRIKFKARTTGGGRGLTGNKIVLDEGFALKPSHLGALLPTLNAIPDPQLLVTSSAGLLSSAVLRSFRDRGRKGLGDRSAYFEWGAPETPCELEDCSHVYGEVQGCALDRRDLWEAAIMTYGIRTNEEKIQAFRETMPPEEFLREFLVWWDDPTGSGPWPKGIWARQNIAPLPDDVTGVDGDLALVASQITGPIRVAIDVTPERKAGALAVAGKIADGRTQVELVDEDEPGIGWLVARAVEVVKAHGADGVWLDPTSEAGALIPALRNAGLEVHEISGVGRAQSCGAFYDGIVDGAIVHIGQQRLDDAVGGAQLKSAGDASRWDRRFGADISPLYAVTFAAYDEGGGAATMFGPDDLYGDDPDEETTTT